MSGGYACACEPAARRWFVLQRRCNHSKFNGRRRTPSRYSEITCTACGRCWRSKGAFVDRLPDAPPRAELRRVALDLSAHVCEGCGARRTDARVISGSDCYWCPDCREGSAA